MQAERFPGLFDGIIAGSPLNAFTAAQTTQIWATRTLQPVSGQRLLGAQQLELLTSAAIARCDTLDGVADGIIEDPRRCNFDPGSLQCSVGATGACLNPTQVAAARSIYAGPAAPPLEELPAIDLPGFAAGSEIGWRFALDSEPSALALEYFRRAVHGNAGWSWRDFDLGRDHALALLEAGWILDTSSADLTRFRDQGGKLIVIQGWNDPVSPPEATIAYFDAIADTHTAGRNAPATAIREFARLFMVPGMQHCGGGTGTDQFDGLRALEDWVERGIAPERIEASRIENGTLARTRPLCPYPQTARYRGNGDSNQSGNFVCTN
jgi:feruloyl esterase